MEGNQPESKGDDAPVAVAAPGGDDAEAIQQIDSEIQELMAQTDRAIADARSAHQKAHATTQQQSYATNDSGHDETSALGSASDAATSEVMARADAAGLRLELASQHRPASAAVRHGSSAPAAPPGRVPPADLSAETLWQQTVDLQAKMLTRQKLKELGIDPDELEEGKEG